MLILNRKVEESIVIGGNIIVKVIEICGKQVRLGIVAPPDVPIKRDNGKNLQEKIIVK